MSQTNVNQCGCGCGQSAPSVPLADFNAAIGFQPNLQKRLCEKMAQRIDEGLTMQYVDQEILKQQQKIDSLSPEAYVRLLAKIEGQQKEIDQLKANFTPFIHGIENPVTIFIEMAHINKKIRHMENALKHVNKCLQEPMVSTRMPTNFESAITEHVNAIDRKVEYFIKDSHTNKRLDVITLSLEGIITRLEAKEAEIKRLGENEKECWNGCNEILERIEALETQNNMMQLHRVSKLEFEKQWNEGMPAEQFEKLKSQVDDLSKWESKNKQRIEKLETIVEEVCEVQDKAEKEYLNFYNQTGELSLDKESRISNLERHLKQCHQTLWDKKVDDRLEKLEVEEAKADLDLRRVSKECIHLDERIKAFIDTAQGLHDRQEAINDNFGEDLEEIVIKVNKIEGVNGFNKVNKSSMNDALIAIKNKFSDDLSFQMGAYLADTAKTLERIDKLERQGTDVNLRKFHDAMDLHFEKFKDKLNSLSSESGDHCKALLVLEEKVRTLFDWKTAKIVHNSALDTIQKVVNERVGHTECVVCDGEGKIQYAQKSPTGFTHTEKENCKNCEGRGMVWK